MYHDLSCEVSCLPSRSMYISDVLGFELCAYSDHKFNSKFNNKNVRNYHDEWWHPKTDSLQNPARLFIQASCEIALYIGFLINECVDLYIDPV